MLSRGTLWREQTKRCLCKGIPKQDFSHRSLGLCLAPASLVWPAEGTRDGCLRSWGDWRKRGISHVEDLIPGSVLEASISSLLVLMKALLESDTISTINCADEETKVENGVHYRNSHGQKVVGIRMSLAAKFPLQERRLNFSFFFCPRFPPCSILITLHLSVFSEETILFLTPKPLC